MFLTVSFLSLAFIALCLTINLVIGMYQDYYKSKQIHKNRKSSAADKTELSNEYEFSHKQSKNLLDGEISITPHSFFLLKNINALPKKILVYF